MLYNAGSACGIVCYIMQAQLVVLAAERDFAVHEMRAMAEHCQTVASEFEQLARHCEVVKEQLEEVCLIMSMLYSC